MLNREIVSAEQPCILCGQLLEFVSVYLDEDTGEERLERTKVPHPQADCLSFLKLHRETWPPACSYLSL